MSRTWLVAVAAVLIAQPARAGQQDKGSKQETSPGAERREGQGAFLGAYIIEDRESGGIVIDKTVPDGPAAKAGFIRGDQIVRIGDKMVFTREDVFSALAKLKPGQTVHISLRRGEKDMKIDVT